MTDRALFGSGLYQNKYRDGIVSAYAFTALLSLISAFFICVLKKWQWKAVPFALLAAGEASLLKLGVLGIGGGWNICRVILLGAACIALFITLESRYQYRLRQD